MKTQMLVAVVVMLGVMWLTYLAKERDLEIATDRTLSLLLGLISGLATIALVTVSNFATFVADAPGVFSTIIVGALGYLSLDGMIEIAPGFFAFLVVATLVGSLAMREA